MGWSRLKKSIFELSYESYDGTPTWAVDEARLAVLILQPPSASKEGIRCAIAKAGGCTGASAARCSWHPVARSSATSVCASQAARRCRDAVVERHDRAGDAQGVLVD